MTSSKRLIEVAFPLKQTSIDSVHEKMVHAGHPKALHIWPARRPLAACRAALIATLLPDSEDEEERKLILEKLGGKLVQRVKRVKNPDGKVEEKIVEETEGGILHWGRESGPDLDWFREKIRAAYGGRVPKVLDPFAGGGAIPLEAMRLGCETTAVDINPVAWFILKCTLEYPQKLAGQTRPLPDFALEDREFMEAFFKAQGLSKPAIQTRLAELGHKHGIRDAQLSYFASEIPDPAATGDGIQADLAWHVRAWGRWVLAQARRDLARFYPTYADFEPLVEVAHKVESRLMQLVPLNEDGAPDLDSLNAEFDEAYLNNKSNPRWVAKPSVAYLWARTVTCKNCRATLPLLKTRWLRKKDKKRVVLTMQPNINRTGVLFGVEKDIPVQSGNIAQRRAFDKVIGGGTMSRSGATCPCCQTIMTMEDIRLEGQAGRLGIMMTSVVIDIPKGKDFRLPTDDELLRADEAIYSLESIFSKIPLGLPSEMLPGKEALGFRIPLYGFDHWAKMFTSRQLLVLGTVLTLIHGFRKQAKYDSPDWMDAIQSYLACIFDKVADYNSAFVEWQPQGAKGGHTFMRWALPIKWDFTENNILVSDSGGWASVSEWVTEPLTGVLPSATQDAPPPNVLRQSAINIAGKFDIIVTDPPYYDAIPYSDLMDFFYVWLRRIFYGSSSAIDKIFDHPLAPKWDHDANDGELIDDSSRFAGDSQLSKSVYEEGMFNAFQACHNALENSGRLVVVFAHKQPNAWETLASAIIRAGFIVDGSWPIQTEMGNRTRSQTSAALSSSVWLVCKKRPTTTRPGWDNRVLDEMHQNITTRLRDFWDAGIRGPDFVWAATGPAMEAYSQYPAVRKADHPGELMSVGEFLGHVRRMVVDFVVGRVLTHNGDSATVSGLDNVTTYYLLHRNDFGFQDAPAGACILYAISCGLSDKDLADRYDLLVRTGGKEAAGEDEITDEDGEFEGGSGSQLRLKTWQQRKRPSLGYDPALDNTSPNLPLFPEMEVELSRSREVPLIDQIHRLMQLWKAGDVNKVNDYLDIRGLRRNQLFQQLLQALIELSTSEERSLLESISNHVVGRGQAAQKLFND